MPLNQRVSAPYGDITYFSTPKTDRFIAQHQLEERQAELQRQREVDEADKQLSSHLGNILNPDIPDVVSGWQEYRNAKKQLLFDEKLKKDPAAYAQKQMEVNTKLANVMGIIGDSSYRKKTLNDQLQLARTSPHKMEDNAAQRIAMGMNTPTTFAKQNPDFDNHIWQGPDEDYTKTFNEARGEERVLRSDKTPMGKNGEQLAVTNVSGFNDPVVYMAALNAKNADRKHSMNAAKVLQNMSPEEIQKIESDYAALPADRFKNWNMTDKPSLEPADPADPVQRLHSIQAKAYALTSQFTTKEGKPEINTEVRRKLNDASKLNLQSAGIRQRLAASKELAAFKKSIGVGEGSGNGGDDYSDAIEPILDRLETDARSGGMVPYKTADGKTVQAFNIKAPTELKKAMRVTDGAKSYEPDVVKVMDNGDYLGVFYKRDKVTGDIVEKNGMYAVDPTLPPVRMLRDDVKITLGKMFLTKKENQKIMQGGAKPGKTVKAKQGSYNDLN